MSNWFINGSPTASGGQTGSPFNLNAASYLYVELQTSGPLNGKYAVKAWYPHPGTPFTPILLAFDTSAEARAAEVRMVTDSLTSHDDFPNNRA